MPPPPRSSLLHDAASQIPQLADDTTMNITIITIPITSSQPSHHNTQQIDPTTLANMSTSTTITTTPVATYQTPTSALQSMPTPLTTSTTPATIATQPGRPPLETSKTLLPDLPPFLAIFLLSWLAMAWAVTAVLYLASFPEKVAWLDRWIERWRRGMVRDRSTLPQSTNSLPAGMTSRVVGNANTNREEPSTAVSTGLGISLMGTPRLRRLCSFDEESLKPRGWSFESSAVSTAPLPSIRSFNLTPGPLGTPRGGVRNRERCGNVNRDNIKVNGLHTLPDFRNETPPEAGGITGVLESVQAVIEFIAGRLAKVGHDEVFDGAEAGLLLPIEDGERQMTVDVCGC